jgi:hypothetical protein
VRKLEVVPAKFNPGEPFVNRGDGNPEIDERSNEHIPGKPAARVQIKQFAATSAARQRVPSRLVKRTSSRNSVLVLVLVLVLVPVPVPVRVPATSFLSPGSARIPAQFPHRAIPD